MNQKFFIKIAGTIRVSFVGLVVIFKILFIAFLVWTLREKAIAVFVGLQVISWITVFWLIGRNKDTPYTLVWLFVITILPVFGFFIYLIWARQATHKARNRKLRQSIAKSKQFLKKDVEVYNDFVEKHPTRKRFVDYLGRKDFPLYQNTKCNYYPLGEQQFDAMIEDMEKAEKFIFISFFIIRSGELWDRFEKVLVKKAAEGVEIRLMCDDLGSLDTATDKLASDNPDKNIQVLRFNPIHRHMIRFSMNYRSHQKIVVIDGNIGYTGGTNIADEYANIVDRYGHWKDTAIRLEGDAVWGMTLTFLQMWEAESGVSVDYPRHQPSVQYDETGFYQPFSDGPVNNPDNPAEVMYNTVIYNARDYLYITTPYLVVDDAMLEALCTAAQGGIDVRIVTPKNWDHWYVNMTTVSNYGELLQSGVKIYEYSPGYIHAKTILSDDEHAITGSINMDYRSFNLHFENGVWICGASVLEDIKRDIIDTIAVSEEIKYDQWVKRQWYIKIMEVLLRPFAVLF